MTTMPWFRMYSEVLHDRKLRKVCQLCKQPKAVVLGVWLTLLAIANDSPERGRLLIGEEIPLDLDDLAEETGLPLPELDAMMTTFKQLGMVLESGDITNWDSRQFRSDNSTERVRKHREKMKHHDETLQQRYETVIDTESDTYTDSNTETEKNKPAVAGLSDATRLFLSAFGAKRFKTKAQREAVEAMATNHNGVFAEGVEWAAKQGMSMGRAILALETALPKWGRPKQTGKKQDIEKYRRTAELLAVHSSESVHEHEQEGKR